VSRSIYGKVILNPKANIPPAPDIDSTPPFEEPWHGQVFAITHKMAQAGYFTWTEWAKRFAVALEQARLAGGATDGSDYYVIWLAAFEGLLVDLGFASPDEVESLVADWKHAYLSTPHGQPVELSRD
jgi:nitrile hydratase accessory protein